MTTLIAGLALLAFGSGPVRGFAVVHCIGILTSMFSAVFFSRGLVNLWYGRQKKLKSVSIGQVWKPESDVPVLGSSRGTQSAIKEEDMEFSESKRHSLHLARVGLQRDLLHHLCPGGLLPVTRGLHLSVEFTGGTVMEVACSQPAELAKVRETVSGLGYDRCAGAELWHARDVLIRLPVQKGVTSAQQSEQVAAGAQGERCG